MHQSTMEKIESTTCKPIPSTERIFQAVRRELEPVWAADTRRKLLALGLWPKALPLKNFSTGDDFELTRKNRT